jgi:hypothetical protein
MQWADSATWDVLEHLWRTSDERILLCLTIRTEEIANVGARLRRCRGTTGSTSCALRVSR